MNGITGLFSGHISRLSLATDTAQGEAPEVHSVLLKFAICFLKVNLASDCHVWVYVRVCVFVSVPDSRDSLNEYVTFLQFSISRFLLELCRGFWLARQMGPLNPDLKWGLIFFLSQAKFASYPLPLQNWVFAKVASGVIQCPSHPGFPQLSGIVGLRATPHASVEHIPSTPSSALDHPSPPWTGRKMHLLLLVIYLFGETEMM